MPVTTREEGLLWEGLLWEGLERESSDMGQLWGPVCFGVSFSFHFSNDVFVSVYTSPFPSLYNCFLKIVFFSVLTELKLTWGFDVL